MNVSDQKIHVTLVHGTFAPNAAWTKPGSPLRTHLHKVFGDRVVIHDQFRWSGWPSHLARHSAGERLREFLLNITAKEPGRHFVVGHSHGGMVTLYALRDKALGQRIEGVVTLSTPFLVARPRQLGFLGWVGFASLHLLVFILATALPAALVAPHFPQGFGSPTPAALLLTALVLTGLLFIWILQTSIAWVSGSLTDWFLETLAIPDLHSERVLIVRGPSDEASAFINLFHAIDLAITAIWGRRGAVDKIISRNARRLERAFGRWPQKQKKAILVGVGVWLLLGLPLILWEMALISYHRWMGVAYGEFIDLPILKIGNAGLDLTAPLRFLDLPWWLLTPAAVLLIPWIVLFIVVGGPLLVSTIVVLPLTAAFVIAVASSAIAALVAVPELGPCTATIVVSAEAAPPGSGTILQLKGDTSEDDGFLLHSLSYTHPAALAALSAALLRWAAVSRPVVIPAPPERTMNASIKEASRFDFDQRRKDRLP